MADSSKKILGCFEIIGVIPGGAQGRLRIARCLEPQFAGLEVGAEVVLKIMEPDPDDEEVQFKKLSKRTEVLASIRHPNIVKYYGCFAVTEEFTVQHVVVLEYLRGQNLKKLIEQQPGGLDVDQTLKIMRDCLAGLSYAAGRGVVHRDIKPANIFVCDDGTPKLIDFEVARQEGGTLTVTSQGNLRGSFDYMAPDFTDSDFRGDERSDIFSLGVCLHEAITGRTPYAKISGSLQQAFLIFLTRWGAAADNPIKISSRIRRLASRLEPVVVKALERDRNKRYSSFKSFGEALQAAKPREIVKGETVYQLLQFIGRGGFGQVFKGRRLSDGKLVAIKHLLKEAYADRFRREANILRKLKESEESLFVQFIDFVYVEYKIGRPDAFLIMELLPGMPGNSLRDRLRGAEQGLPMEEVMHAFARFADALHVMHSMGVIHRDIKPSNLYFPQGRCEASCVMDLGVARNVKGTLTLGPVPGTLDYMPPEIALSDGAAGSKRGDAAMDIYALGLCFYEALTGKPLLPRLPSGNAGLAAFVQRSVERKMPVLDDPIVKDDERLHQLLVRMTHPEVTQRECDAGRIAAEIRAIAGIEEEEVPQGEPNEGEGQGPVLEPLQPIERPPPTEPLPPTIEPQPPTRGSLGPTVGLSHQEDETKPAPGGGVDADRTVVSKGVPSVSSQKTIDADRTAVSKGVPSVSSQKTIDADRTVVSQGTPSVSSPKTVSIPMPKQKRSAPKTVVPPKVAAAVLWLGLLLVAAGYGGWHFRGQIKDRVESPGFYRLVDGYEHKLEELAEKARDITAPADYIDTTNQVAETTIKMGVDFASRFARLLSGERRTNRKAAGEYQSLTNNYAAFFGSARQAMEEKADADKNEVLDVYRRAARDASDEEAWNDGEAKYAEWKEWKVCLSPDQFEKDAEELDKAREDAIGGRTDKLLEAALESYRDDKLEGGKRYEAMWREALFKQGKEPSKDEENEITQAQADCVARLEIRGSLERIAKDVQVAFESKNAGRLTSLYTELKSAISAAEKAKVKAEIVDRAKQMLTEVGGYIKKVKEIEENLAKIVEEAQDALRPPVDVKRLEEQSTELQKAILEAEKVKIDVSAAKQVLAAIDKRVEDLTNPVPLTIADAKGLRPPVVVVEWSKDKKEWKQVELGLKVPPGDVWVRFRRDDYTMRDSEQQIKVEPGKGCRLSAPTDWKPTQALANLNELSAAVDEHEWNRAAELVKAAEGDTLINDQHLEKRRGLIRIVEEYFNVLFVERLQGAIKDLCQKNDGESLAKLQWPKDRDVVGDERVKDAERQAAVAVTNWVSRVALADDPLETRAERLATARNVLGTASVRSLLEDKTRVGLSQRVEAKQAYFVLRIENGSGHEVAVQIGDQSERLMRGAVKDVELMAAPAVCVARVDGCKDQKLDVTWSRGGGQKMTITGPFEPLPIKVEIAGNVPALEPPVNVILRDTADRETPQGFGTKSLPPGKYRLRFTRADYQDQSRDFTLAPSDKPRTIEVPADWTPSVALSTLREAERLYKDNKIAEAYTKVGSIGALAYKGHEQAKEKLESDILSYYRAEITNYIEVCRERYFRHECAKVDNETPTLGLPSKPVIPERVWDDVPAEVRKGFDEPGSLTDEQNKAIAKGRDAYNYFKYMDPQGFNDQPINTLAEAVKLGFMPTANMMQKAQHAYELCVSKLKALIDVGVSPQVIESTKNRLKIAEDNMKVIAEAML